jgi:hypothetical protein
VLNNVKRILLGIFIFRGDESGFMSVKSRYCVGRISEAHPAIIGWMRFAYPAYSPVTWRCPSPGGRDSSVYSGLPKGKELLAVDSLDDAR